MTRKSEMDSIRTELNDEDRNILKNMEDTADCIAAFFGNHCEVSLNSLEDPKHSIIKIVNSHHTKRKIGDKISDHGLQAVLDFMKTGRQDHSCYTTSSAAGGPMRTNQTVIVNRGRAIGLLCISLNMNVPLAEFISVFSLFHQPSQPDMILADSVEGVVHNAVNDIVVDISTNISIPNHEKNKYIVYGLYEKGIFEIKGSVVLVAKELKLSKYTIYSYIRELKK
jgi:predicted transcriptional regulator YheO